MSLRRYPLLATVAVLAIGMFTTTWGAGMVGQDSWSVPHDYWRTLVAADRLLHLDVAHLYTRPTLLISFPGAAVVLVPVAALVDASGLSLAFQTAQNPRPPAWLLVGPCEILVAATVLFAADAMAERLGAGRAGRALLAAAGGVGVWSVSVRWGHPEDAVALAGLLWAVLALSDGRLPRSAWWMGAAVAVQPLVLLGLPVLLAALPLSKLPGYLARAALPGAVLLGLAAAANWPATVAAVTSQPNWPLSHSTHRTPWTSLSPELGDGAVAAGPGRVVAIALACGCAVLLHRRWRGRDPGTWTDRQLAGLLWFVALTLAFRCVFESVMVAYYLWPVLAIALVVAAAGDQYRQRVTSVAVVVVTALAEASWRGPWLWWAVMVAGLALVLLASSAAVGRVRPGKPGAGAHVTVG